MVNDDSKEPWLRGTLTEVPAVHRAVLHALELAEEDIAHWCGELTAQELNEKPGGIASVGFHMRHIGRSADRLLTYAEGRQLSMEQMGKLKTEMDICGGVEEELAEFRVALLDAARRVHALQQEDLEGSRFVGQRALPTSLVGLLIHVAEHTQRHVGQAITTAKVIRAERRK
jgi:uncharacterized damage-inducible protein DinB